MRLKLWKIAQIWSKRRRFEADLAEEVRFHREMSGAAAFGSEALVLEQSRDVWGFGWLDSWKQDIRYAIRGLRKSPGFAIAVIAAIGLGIGLNTTVFTVFNTYALRPYAVRDPYALYSFTWYGKNGQGHIFSWREFESAREQRAIFSDVMATDNLAADVAGRTMFGQLVSDNYFDALGVGMQMGRPLLPGDRAVMVLSYEAWRNKFGADPAILGRKLYMRGQPFEVIGVVNPKFTGLESFPTGLWIPLSMAPAVKDDSLGVGLIGRLQPGVGVDAAKAGLLPWARRFSDDIVGIAMLSQATGVPLTRDSLLTFLPMFAAFGMVLLIACANVSNMMLARALARQREIAIRVSLGAGRARLVRQLLTEAVILAAPAAGAGFLISEATIEGARRLLFATVPPAFGRILAIADMTPDWRVFAYILAASLVTALLFGLAPAIQTTRSRLVEANRGDFSSDHRPARLRNLLVVAQVGVCALLLICTAIVLRSERRVTDHDIGLDMRGVWDLRMMERYQAKAAERLSREPGVTAVATAWHAPLYGSQRRIGVIPSGSKDAVQAGYNFVSPGYFPVFRLPVVRGRVFSDPEAAADAAVVVVSEATARRFWPGQEAIGQTIAIPPAPRRDVYTERAPAFAEARVIGVVRDAISGMIASGPEETCIYFPNTLRTAHNDSVLVRMNGAPAETRRRLEAALDQIAPSLSDFINPMEEVKALQVYPFRVISWLAGFLGGVALLLTVSGIYGVMSYLVSQRTKEIGIRVALGAATADILNTILRHAARLAAIGAAAGVGLALMIAPVFAHELEVIKPYDWAPYVATVTIVIAAAVGASYAPSRRALRIDPARTLRGD